MNPGDLVRDRNGNLLMVRAIQTGRNALRVRSVATNDIYDVSPYEVTPVEKPPTRRKS